jgi:hypothetical protein
MNHPIAERLVPDAKGKLRNQLHKKLPKKVSVNQVVISCWLPPLPTSIQNTALD